MILIGLLYNVFCDNLNNQTFPSHVIHVSKQDVSKIKEIDALIAINISAINLNSLSFDSSKLKRLSMFT